MGSENGENKKCEFEDIVLPEEVKLTYYPQTGTKYGYDVLPLFELNEYKMKLADEVSILKNPTNANKWKEFIRGLPDTLREPKVTAEEKIAVFANYKRQKVPPKYWEAYIGPSSPDAIFRKEK